MAAFSFNLQQNEVFMFINNDMIRNGSVRLLRFFGGRSAALFELANGEQRLFVRCDIENVWLDLEAYCA